jgi:hypothetical protein
MATSKQIFYVISIALMVLLSMMYLPFSQHYWLLASALAALFVTHKKISYQSNYVCGGMLAAITASCGGMLAGQFLWMGIFLFFTTVATILIGISDNRYWRSAFIVNLFAVVGCAFAVNDEQALQRCGYILGGFVIVTVLQMIFFHNASKREVKVAFADALQAAAALGQTIFTFFLAKDYQALHFNYERQWHSNNVKFLKKLRQSQWLLNYFHGDFKSRFAKVLSNIEQLHEILMAMWLLIDRVEDHTTFDVATKEFTRLSDGMLAYLHALAAQLRRQKFSLPEDFSEAIDELQEVNHDALQVVAREPIVFLLFVQDFIALNYIFIQLVDAIAEVE